MDLSYKTNDGEYTLDNQGFNEFIGGVMNAPEGTLAHQVRNDILKKDLCEKNNIKLLYYTNNNDELITDLTTLKIKIYES